MKSLALALAPALFTSLTLAQTVPSAPPALQGDARGTIELQIVGPDTHDSARHKAGTMAIHRVAEGHPPQVTWDYEDGTSASGFAIPFPDSPIFALSFGTGAKTLAIYRRDGTKVAGRWAATSPDAEIKEISLSQGATRAEYLIEGGGSFQIDAIEGDVATVTWSHPSGDVQGIGVASGDFLALISIAPGEDAGVGIYEMAPDAKSASATLAVAGTAGATTQRLEITAMTGTFLTSDAASIEHELKHFAAAFHKDLAAAADLRPTPEQIAAIASTPEGAEKLAAYVDAVYAQLTPGQPAADPAQTEIIFGGPDLDDLPGGYSQKIAHFKPGTQFYSFQYVKPGETLGMSYDGLCRLDGTWVFIPKAWRAFSQ